MQNPAGEVKEYDYEYYDDTKPASPFVNPHDPTHRQVRLKNPPFSLIIEEIGDKSKVVVGGQLRNWA